MGPSICMELLKRNGNEPMSEVAGTLSPREGPACQRWQRCSAPSGLVNGCLNLPWDQRPAEELLEVKAYRLLLPQDQLTDVLCYLGTDDLPRGF